MFLNKGEIIGLIGVSGVGKSSLLRSLVGFDKLTQGQLFIAGKSIDNGLGNSDWRFARQKVGIVFQDLYLWSYRTVLENIMEGLIYVLKIPKKQAKDHAKEVAFKLGISEKLHRYPEELSGGEKQRVALARALVMKPDVLLLDEITSSLDPLRVASIGEIIRDLASEGIGIILTTHQLRFVELYTDRLYFLHDGIILESGKSEETLNHPQTNELQEFVQRIYLRC